MATKRFITPFAEAGDRAEISDLPVGTDVNFQTGYPAEYEADPVTDPAAKFVERDKTNQLFNDITGNIKHWQENTYPEFITEANNGGSAFPYKEGAIVTYNGFDYISLIDNNTTLPTSSDWDVYIPEKSQKALKLKIFQSPTDNLTKISTFAGGVGVAYEVRKTSDNSLATIYSDKDGVTSIPQNGTANVSNGDAECVFYIGDGIYTLTISGSTVGLSVVSDNKFFNILTDVEPSKAILNSNILVGGVSFSVNDNDGFSIGGGKYLLADEDVNFTVFGGDDGGVDDSLSAIQAAFEHAKAAGVNVTQTSGRFALRGSGNINISVDCDLSSCEIDVDGWSGQFIINRDEQLTEYLAGSNVVNAIESSSRLSAGTARFDGLNSTRRELEGCFIVIDTDQDFYTYRGVVQKRKEFNTVYNLGVLSSVVKYSLVGVNITKVSALKISSSKMQVKGLAILETDVTNCPGGIIVSANDVSRLSIDLSFITGTAEQTANTERFRANRCPHLRINGLYTDLPIKNVSGTYGYSFGLYDCYDIICDNIKSDGWGWGVHGDGENQKLVIKNSTISRVDQHRPFREYLKVIDSEVGNWGVTVVGVGDLILERTDFIQRDGRNFDGIITGRLDGGSFIDGSLIINETSIEGFEGTNYPVILKCEVNDQNFLPLTSPINPTFFSDITIDGLKLPAVGNGNPLIQSVNIETKFLKFPHLISVENVRVTATPYDTPTPAIRVFTVDTSGFAGSGEVVTDSRTGILTNKIVYNNVNVDWFQFVGDNNDIRLDFHGYALSSGQRYLRPNFEITQHGRFELTDCRLGNIFTDSISTTDIALMMNGGVLNPDDGSASNVLAQSFGSYFELRNTDVIYRSSFQLSNVNANTTQKNINLIDKT